MMMNLSEESEVARMKCFLFHPGLQHLTPDEIKSISSGLLRYSPYGGNHG